MADVRVTPAGAAENPPPRVLGAARRAFGDAVRGAVRIPPAHDAWDNARVVRTLVFRADDVSLVLTCRVVPGGVRLAGGFLGTPGPARLVLQRPARPSVRLDPGDDLRIAPTRLPRGLVSFAAEYEDSGGWAGWRSDWLRL
jgi:hypothetical protein